MAGRKKSVSDGRRRGRTEEEPVQDSTAEVQDVAPPVEHEPVRMTEVERLSLAALDAEMRNAGQGIKILDLEWERVQREFVQQQHIFSAKKTALVEQFNDRQKLYNRFITELGVRYHIDPKHMTFDTETGVLRSLQQGA